MPPTQKVDRLYRSSGWKNNQVTTIEWRILRSKQRLQGVQSRWADRLSQIQCRPTCCSYRSGFNRILVWIGWQIVNEQMEERECEAVKRTGESSSVVTVFITGDRASWLLRIWIYIAPLLMLVSLKWLLRMQNCRYIYNIYIAVGLLTDESKLDAWWMLSF